MFFLIPLLANCQTNTNDSFAKYSAKQDSMMVDAYTKRDASLYGDLLNQFVYRYNELNEPDKKQFKQYLFGAYYNFACTFSLLHDSKNALRYLGKSIDAGFYNYSHIMKDTDLDFIRDEKEFKLLTNKIRSVGDYLYILKRAGEYNTNDKRPLPAFTYQNSSNPNLVELRKFFNLDSIAGGGTDVSRILNMMHWIHDLIPHDGSHGNPTVKNAMSMIEVCKNEGRGLNCRGLAIVLNECYLAMGIKSRFVTCLPKDSLKIDTDCHVIDMVYSTSLKKWLWIDPTFDAYVMNEKGEMLSIEEVRERIINGKPLILNPDANWNHRTTQTKENYLMNYMAKNLYMLECSASSEYNLETQEKEKIREYIRLLPLDYFKQLPDKEISENKAYDSEVITYKTNNPKAFWAKPGD